jgi:hypothetical protein
VVSTVAGKFAEEAFAYQLPPRAEMWCSSKEQTFLPPEPDVHTSQLEHSSSVGLKVVLVYKKCSSLE